ncbi:MAG TPA: hypothetical protein VKF41_02690 [Bryobacteraceae bacterium]|nr:hypothetical protein [Bryobacteraceae bacterium]
MHTSGQLRIDPGTLEFGSAGAEIEIVVPYTERALTEAALKRVTVLTAGLNAAIRLVAVHAIPYPQPFHCPAALHAHLVEQLVDLASRCPLAVDPQVVLARYRDDGFRHVLKPASIVLIGARKRLFPTREEKLARALARDGHQVVLLHIEEEEKEARNA